MNNPEECFESFIKGKIKTKTPIYNLPGHIPDRSSSSTSRSSTPKYRTVTLNCQYCGGKGQDYEKCEHCGGDGVITIYRCSFHPKGIVEVIQEEQYGKSPVCISCGRRMTEQIGSQPCSYCGGDGKTGYCFECNGTGKITKTEKY